MKKIFFAFLTILAFVGCSGKSNKTPKIFSVDGVYYGAVQTGNIEQVPVQVKDPKTNQLVDKKDDLGNIINQPKVSVTGYMHRILIVKNGEMSVITFDKDLKSAHRRDYYFDRTKNVLKYKSITDSCEDDEYNALEAMYGTVTVKKYITQLDFNDGTPFVPLSAPEAANIMARLQPLLASPQDCQLENTNKAVSVKLSSEKNYKAVQKDLTDLRKTIGTATPKNYAMAYHTLVSIFSPESAKTGE